MARQPDFDVPRLCKALQRSRLVLRKFREERRDAVRQFVGRHWSEEGTQESVPVNLLALYVGVMSSELVGQNPRLMLATRERSQKPVVHAMERWANAEIERLELGATLKRVVTDALFSVGVCKVALATPAESGLGGWAMKAGEPFAEAVDLDDFVFDVHARDFRQASYVGHRVRVPLEIVRASKVYGPARKDLAASPDALYNLEGDERIGVLGKTTLSGQSEEFEDFVDLWEVYLPRHRVVLTLADDQLTSGGDEHGDALREQPWLGPDCGPYHVLGYATVPGNAMPKAPVQDLYDLHLSYNHVVRKLIRQAERQKGLLLVQGGADADGNRIVAASDGDAVRVDNPQGAKAADFGGPNQQNFMLSDSLKQLFAYAARNLDMIGGLAPQSKTLGQDKLLASNANRAVADMQETTVNFTARILRSLCWYWHHDPFRVMRTTFSVAGMPEVEVPTPVTPDQRRQGKFEDLDVSVDPYSLKHKTPEERMQALQTVVTQVVTPMMPLMQEQGIGLDLNALLQKMGRYLDMPDLAEIVTVQEPPEVDGESGADPTRPPQKETTHVRENRPGRTQAADSAALRGALAGVDQGGDPALTNGRAGG